MDQRLSGRITAPSLTGALLPFPVRAARTFEPPSSVVPPTDKNAAMDSAFARETAVTRAGEGHYEGTIAPAWNLRPLPHGGVVTTMAVRAMSEELGDANQRLRILHTTFVAQVAHGSVEIEVDVLRRGRSMSHLRAEVANPGADRGHITTAIFGSTRARFNKIASIASGIP